MKKRVAEFNNHTTPLMTIVVNHRSGSDALQKCLESIIEQSYPNIEVVLYDFGTTNGSWEYAVSFQQKNPGIITLLRTRIDFALDQHETLYPNIRGRYFMVIDSAILLREGVVSLAVTAIKNKIGCAYVLMGNNYNQERERFYGFNCELSGFDHLKNHLLSVPYPGSSIVLYDSDIAKTSNNHNPYTMQATLCFKFSVISISEPQFEHNQIDEFEILYPHFISLCNQKIKLIGLIERVYDFISIDQIKKLIWKRFALELLFLAKTEIEKASFETAINYFFLAVAQYPHFITAPWYSEVHDSLLNKSFSSFWREDFPKLYISDRISPAPANMVPMDEE